MSQYTERETRPALSVRELHSYIFKVLHSKSDFCHSRSSKRYSKILEFDLNLFLGGVTFSWLNSIMCMQVTFSVKNLFYTNFG